MLVSDTAIEFNGLTVVQVSQNQAAVISDPQVHGIDAYRDFVNAYPLV
jgi:hypothetical protein